MAVSGCSCCSTAVCQYAELLVAVDDDAYVGRTLADGPVTADLPPPDSARGPDFVDSVPGSIASTATLALGGSVEVIIETPSDHDWYRVTLTAGTTYTINTTALSGGGNPDSLVTLRDAAGAFLIDDDDGGDGTYSTISYTPTTTGTYFVDAGTFAGSGQSSSGSYYLSIAAVLPAGADSVAGTTATTGALAVGGSIDGNIDTSGDRDWYAITLTAGQSYLFRTASVGPLSGTAPAGRVDTLLAVRDASGTQLASNDDAGEYGYSAIRFTASTTGTYYLDVGGFTGSGGNGASTGAFNLTAFTAPALTVYTYDQIALQLTNGYWGGNSHRFNVAPGGTITVNFSTIGAAAQTLAREALNLWTDVTGITFTSVASGAQITFADTQTGAFANASYSGGITTSANINVGTTWLTSFGTTLNSYSFQTYIHEIGHVLGLGHGGNYNNSASYATDALYANDSWVSTIMSYFDQNENTYTSDLAYTRQYSVSPMVADIVAVANLYGANTLTRTGNTTYGFNNTSGRVIYDAALLAFPGVSYTIYDNGGIDTLDYSGFSANQTINLNQEDQFGPWISTAEFGVFAPSGSDIGGRVGNVWIARGAVIENAIGGSGNDSFIGNSAVNQLTGGRGNDRYYIDSALDTIIELPGEGQDTVITALSTYTLPANVDDLYYTGTGTGTGTLYGNISSNQITGSDGADRFDFSQGGNFDWAYGRGGDDSFFFGATLNTDDRVNGGGGANDQVGITGNYTGASRLVLSATTLVDVDVLAVLPGGSYDITLNNGTAAAGATFTVFGGNLGVGESFTVDASAELDGNVISYGGLGTDTILGGAGADGFYFGPGKYGATDGVRGGGGTNDQLALDGDYTLTLTNREEVEVFVMLRGPVGTPNTFNVTIDNSFTPAGQQRTIFGTAVTTNIVANGAAETDGTLRFFSGTGNDTLTGGAGADRFFGNLGADTLTGGGGADTFVYNGANESTGAAWDRLVGLTNGVDKIDLPGTISSVATTVASGTLNTASFNADLSAAIGAGQMGAGQAVLFAPTGGTLGGRVFLVADANGIAGYQADADFVFELPTPPPTITPDLFV